MTEEVEEFVKSSEDIIDTRKKDPAWAEDKT